MNQPRILIVDDEASVRFVLEQTLKNQGYLLDSVGSGTEALNKLAETDYDVILLDLHMEPVDGLTVFQAARELDSEVFPLEQYGEHSSVPFVPYLGPCRANHLYLRERGAETGIPAQDHGWDPYLVPGIQ